MPIDIVNHFELQVTDLTVDQLKQLIHEKLRTPAPMQSIIYKCQELADGARRLSEYGVHVDDTLCLVIKGGENDNDEEDNIDDEFSAANEYQQPAALMQGNADLAQDAGNAVDEMAHDANPTVNPAMTVLIVADDGVTTLTTIDPETTDTVLYLKIAIQQVLGHDFRLQRLHVGGPALDDRAQMNQIPEVMENGVVYLTILNGYWFNTW